MDIRISLSSIIVISLYITLICFAIKFKGSKEDIIINLCLIILGSLLGWVVGIFLSPYNEEQRVLFLKYASSVSLFVSGYLIGKVDKAFSYIIKPEKLFTPIIGFRFLNVLISFVLGMLITTIIRMLLSS